MSVCHTLDPSASPASLPTSKTEGLWAGEGRMEEEAVYRTWPDRLGQGTDDSSSVTRRPSLSSLLHPSPESGGVGHPMVHPSPEIGGVGQPMSLACALDRLAISYSPKTRGLHSISDCARVEELDLEKEPVEQEEMVKEVEQDENQSEVESSTATRYVPAHRKAFSLPRTLEVVDELGAISPAIPSAQVESPRSTLLRYGLPYKPYNFHRDIASQEDDSMSSISGLTDHSETKDSLGDSGIFSEASSVSLKQTKKGISEFLSMGQKLISRSSQQVARMMRKDAGIPLRTEASNTGSSELEAVSSVGLIMETRPPGVPAKSLVEEERHRQQHRELLEEVKRREQEEGRERARKLAEQWKTEDDLSSLTSYWSHTVLPAWTTHRYTKKTQALWWRGLPPPVRGRVWSLALTNSLNLTSSLYIILSTRAREQLEAGTEARKEETLDLIRLDVSRTFPQLGIFQTGGPYHQLLQNILGAYVCYRPDLGYVQGMSFIAAILLLNLEEAEAFIVFANLVNRPCLAAFYRIDTCLMSQYYAAFSSLLSFHLPRLARHFSRLGLRPELYMLDWVMTLFSKAAPLDLTCRLWDLLIRDGEQFLFRAALGLLGMYQDQLLAEQDFILLAQFLARFPESIDADSLFANIEELGSGGLEVILP